MIREEETPPPLASATGGVVGGVPAEYPVGSLAESLAGSSVPHPARPSSLSYCFPQYPSAYEFPKV